jgi:hypothetical protein
MIARGCKVCVSTRVAINFQEFTKAGILGVPIGYSIINTLLPGNTSIASGKVDVHIKASSRCSYWLQHLLLGVQGMYNSAGLGRKPPQYHCQYQQRVQGSHLLDVPIGQVLFTVLAMGCKVRTADLVLEVASYFYLKSFKKAL